VRRIVIVGAGLAGHRAAQALRREGFDGELVIVGDEEHLPYDRPPLSKQLLAGSIERAECFYGCDDLDARWVLGQPATALDTDSRRLRVDTDELKYDGLVIATGRRAREWPELPALEGFHTLRNLDDTRALRAAVGPGGKAAIVGAGFIGCEVAATLRGLGLEEVTLIDVASHPMPPLGPEVGKRALELHERRGVRMRMGTSVAMFEGAERVEAVRLEDGERIETDFVLFAVGSVPNSEWLVGSGLELHKGTVVCDQHCVAVGHDDVVAAGDIASYPHPGADGPIWIEHWSNARDMGATAATNLLKGPDEREVFAAVPTFWSDQYDVKIKSAGLLSIADQHRVVEEDPERPSLVVEAYSGDELIGAVVFNRNRTIIGYQRQLADALAVEA
jgi:3-phenylpropionate/trans-cinnamate dioxygenase ferredoxin reductase subunit